MHARDAWEKALDCEMNLGRVISNVGILKTVVRFVLYFRHRGRYDCTKNKSPFSLEIFFPERRKQFKNLTANLSKYILT